MIKNTKYLISGQEVEILKEVDGKFLVCDIVESFDSETGYSETYTDYSQSKLVEKVFDSPPKLIYDTKINLLKREVSLLEKQKAQLELQKQEAQRNQSNALKYLMIMESKEGFYFYLDSSINTGILHSSNNKYKFQWTIEDNQFKCWAKPAHGDGYTGSHCLIFQTIEDATKGFKIRLESSLKHISSSSQLSYILKQLSQAKEYGVELGEVLRTNLFGGIKAALLKEKNNLIFNLQRKNAEIEELNSAMLEYAPTLP